jgi:hypothetical protein
LNISYGLKEGKAHEKQVRKVAKKFSMQINQPIRAKLFKNDVLFLEENAFITVESPFEIQKLAVSARFGNNEAVVTRLFSSQKVDLIEHVDNGEQAALIL